MFDQLMQIVRAYARSRLLGGVCRRANPYTGGCSCPTGTTVRGYRTIVLSGASRMGATI